MNNLARILLVLVLVLVLLGIALVFSASGTYSAMKFNNIYFLFKSHLWKVIVALGTLVIFSAVPYKYYKEYSKYALIGVFFLLLITFLFAKEYKGAARWVDLGIFKFQPSELAKIVLIMHLAKLIEKKGDLIRDYKKGVVYALVWVMLISGMVLVQPNVSTAGIIVLSSFTLLYVGGARFRHIAGTLGIMGMLGGTAMMLFSHSRERVMTFVNSLINGGDINIQVMQAKIALGSGGVFGRGIGHSRQSDLFLPESYGDFIFSVLGEEMGFIGVLVVLSLYLAVFFVGLIIAKRANDSFGQLLGFGLSFNIILSAFINAGVVIGILPTTGITLPFISFGGTSIIIFCMSIGILINIALQTYKSREPRLVQS